MEIIILGVEFAYIGPMVIVVTIIRILVAILRRRIVLMWLVVRGMRMVRKLVETLMVILVMTLILTELGLRFTVRCLRVLWLLVLARNNDRTFLVVLLIITTTATAVTITTILLVILFIVDVKVPGNFAIIRLLGVGLVVRFIVYDFTEITITV